MNKKALQVALAYVGIIVGAGLSSGQDLLQYFIGFGYAGIIGVVILAILNIIFGKIIIATGCYYHSNSHDQVLSQIAHPITKKILDWTLIVSGFVIAVVMIAGAGSNLEQQFGLPFWMGGLLCTGLIILVSFLDIDKIMNVLGMFTPVLLVMIVVITAFTFIGKSYDFSKMNVIAQTIPTALPNIWLSVINYFSLCMLTGVSMAFILGGSLIRIPVAKKGGMIGGFLIGVIMLAATMVLFARIDVVKDAPIPMLQVVQEISPWFAVVYALTIFCLIFNTAFSLLYSLAARIASGDTKKMRMIMILLSSSAYALSFIGFKTLIAKMYPILGYLGIILLVVLVRAWVMNQSEMYKEQKIRRRMLEIARKYFSPKHKVTSSEKKEFLALADASTAESDVIIEDIKADVKAAIEESSPSAGSSLAQ